MYKTWNNNVNINSEELQQFVCAHTNIKISRYVYKKEIIGTGRNDLIQTYFGAKYCFIVKLILSSQIAFQF